MFSTLAYIFLMATAALLSTCAPLWLAVLVFMGAVAIAFKHELRNASATPRALRG